MASMKNRGGLTHGRGLTDSVRAQRVGTMHQRASIHDAMMTLTGKGHMTSEQHVDLSKSRQSGDQADIGKLLEWSDLNDPFTTDSTEL